MALTKVTSGVRTLGAGEVATANMAVDPTNASNLSSGSVPLAQLGLAPSTDTTTLEDDIALLGFKVAVNGSLAKYNLVDQTEDAFMDATGIDAVASTGETRNASNYYSGVGSGPTGGVESTYIIGGVNYAINKFIADGSFVLASTTTLDVLIVAGGAGGNDAHDGGNGGGGGGAGGFVFYKDYPLSVLTNAVVVGPGSAAGSGTGATANGTNSSFGALVAAVGGGGVAGGDNAAGTAGGSGGAGGGVSGSGGAGTTTTISGRSAIQGNAGGNSGTSPPNYGVAGGGGAETVGGGTATPPAGVQQATATAGGGGGLGYTEGDTVPNFTYISNGGAAPTTVTFPAAFQNGSTNSSYAGGGGGNSNKGGTPGPGGIGGGASGTTNAAAAQAGTANTGGGGGSAGCNSSDVTGAAGAGGSGVVIVKSIIPAQDMVLQSNSTTADATATKGDIVMTYTNGSGTATLNTDLTAEFSADNGSNWTSMTLEAQGTTGSASPHFIVSAHNVTADVSGTGMKYRIKTLNQGAAKETQIQAVSLGWS